MQAYKQSSAGKYRYLATLDTKTCEVCGALDGEIFELAEAKEGVNYPPMHPNDRCTTVVHFDGEDLSRLKRRARDPKTGKTHLVPGDMTYEQWSNGVNEKAGYDIIKSSQNSKRDTEQYERYKAVLGKENVAEGLEEFQKMKYNNNTTEREKYSDLRYYSNYINGRPIEYVKIDREMRKLGITMSMKGCAYPVTDVEVSGWTSHAERRLASADVSRSEVIAWKGKAIVMMQKYPAPETQYNFYCDDGVIGINAARCEVTTIIAKERFMEDTKKILEVSKKWLKT